VTNGFLSGIRDDIPGGADLCAIEGGRTMAAFPENQRAFIYI
jgi:hypothetical protein